MSRVGLSPIEIPSGVEVKLAEGAFTAKGKLGEQSVPIAEEVEVVIEDNQVVVKPRGESLRERSMWGTMRSLMNNAVVGVANGFTKRLVITGVGYRAQVQGKNLTLQLGYSHDINYPIPEGIDIQLEGDRSEIVAVTGVSKQRVGQVASEIRAFRKPEPYKGKGIKYDDEQILRKEGKKK
jgi:large subunit ribosomal protein L6|tara:strand:+ start:865 stop:1404 length:540 start_codon:yes stop_codon:yes gene_type:complete